MRVLIACDPGKYGGIAIALGGTMYSAFPMPETDREIADLIRQAIDGADESEAIVEQVGGYIGEKQPGSRAFAFGKNFGFLLGVLTTLGIRIVMVQPQTWQKALGLGIMGRARLNKNANEEEKAAVKRFNEGVKREWKRKLRDRAQQLFPGLEVTLATCDACLLLEYAKRTSNPP